jgi:hypothetical protein
MDVICVDTGYAKEKVYAFLDNEGGSSFTPAGAPSVAAP